MELRDRVRTSAWRGRERRVGGAGQADDVRLVAGLRQGSEMAFSALVQQHEAPMLRVARTYVSNQASAEDVVQETWIAVLRGIDGFGARSSLKTWMYRILSNRAKTAAMRERRCVPDSAFTEREIDGYSAVPADRFLRANHPQWPHHWRCPPLAWERTLEDGIVRREAVGIAGDAIDQLALQQRLVITLRDVECWTSEEVCDVLHITSANQRVLLHRARSKVRARLESHYGIAEG